MKITKKELAKIIKEEAQHILEGGAKGHRGNPNDPWDALFPPGSGKKKAAAKSKPKPMSKAEWDEIERKRKPWDAFSKPEEEVAENLSDQAEQYPTLEDEIKLEFKSDLEELLMTALNNDIPNTWLSEKLMEYARSMKNHKHMYEGEDK